MLRPVLILTAIFALIAGSAHAAEPPNQNDPCSRDGRNTCGTTGKGSYRNYRYGIRWFGDYRGAVQGVSGGTFCIDLRFWYPSPKFNYRLRSAAGLKNKDGKAVSALKLRRMNRALWRFGRSNQPDQQAAVMIYVHQLMGDAAPGEADERALSPAGQRFYAQVKRDAERFAGPYKVRVTVPEKLVAGKPANVTVEVLTSAGRRVPNVNVSLRATGAGEVPARVSTGARGVARVAVTGTDPTSGLTLEAQAESLPAALPNLYVPTRGQSARNAQRLVNAATVRPSATVRAAVKAQPAIATQVSEQVAAPGAKITDTVRVTGLGGMPATIEAALYGPYPSRDAMTCNDAPVWTGRLDVPGDGEYVTEPVTLSVPGYYTYREWIVETAALEAVQTPCGEVSETTVVRGAPAIVTQISAQETAPGSSVTDSVAVSGLGRLSATVNAELWGPYATREEITCEGTPFWSGTFTATGDGTYTTEPVTLTKAGYYTYRESIAASEAFDAVVTPCAEVSETTLAKAAPTVSTVVSDAVVKPGGQIFDRLTVRGLGQTPATISLALYGPYASRDEIDCEGRPYWTGEVEVNGDGTYNSPRVAVRRAGFFVFRERIEGSETIAAHEAECQVEAETSLGAPSILGGRGDRVAQVLASQARGAPSRVRLDRIGINAQVRAIGIDLEAGALGIPADIKRVGWWRDGAQPGDRRGTVLLAGHVDSRKRGAGALYALKSARPGDVVTLQAGARTYRYRVTRVASMRKSALPKSIYTRSGPRRLVIVTCGGPFDPRTRHYRDNVVVTAVPA
jgi:hypothetical protein